MGGSRHESNVISEREIRAHACLSILLFIFVLCNHISELGRVARSRRMGQSQFHRSAIEFMDREISSRRSLIVVAFSWCQQRLIRSGPVLRLDSEDEAFRGLVQRGILLNRKSSSREGRMRR